MMNNYRDIKTLEELNTALHSSKALVAAKEKQFKRRFDKARSFYTPKALVAEGSRKLVSKLPLTDIALFFIGKLRKVLK